MQHATLMQGIILILIIAGVSLLTSFFCSLMEACLYSVSQSHIETLRHKGDPRGETLAGIRNNIDESIATILIINTIANSMGVAWACALVREEFGSGVLVLFSGALTFSILFFAEIVPKSLGVRFSKTLAPMLALPLQILSWILKPAVTACVYVTRKLGTGGSENGTEEDIISMARLVQKQGDIHLQEAQWVANALNLNNVTTYDLMTPGPVVARVPGVMTLRNTPIDADHWRFSRLPVCANHNPDEILGVVHRRKVFESLARDEFDLRITDLMEPAEFVSKDLLAHRLLDRFLQKRKHLFCVLDNEQFIGVVTLEDVLECLIGREIVDETDLHDDMQALAQRRKENLLSHGKKPFV